MEQFIFDLRKRKGLIYNVKDVISSKPLNVKFTGLKDKRYSEDNWIDDFLFEGFKAHGVSFLEKINGRFGCVKYDKQEKKLYIFRDALGEIPLYYLVTLNGIYIANNIQDIKDNAKDFYRYSYIRAFPHSSYQVFDLSKVTSDNFENTIKLSPPSFIVNFSDEVLRYQKDFSKSSNYSYFKFIYSHFCDSVIKRAKKYKDVNLLLSGGLDSLTVGVILKKMGIDFTAITLSTGNGDSSDLQDAKLFAKKLGVKHRVYEISKEEIISEYESTVQISEAYHLYNVYCALAMNLLGKKLKDDGIKMAFSGEAVNEAIGDYRDWTVYNSNTNKFEVLQKINKDNITNTKDRIAYVWGNSSNNSKYNRQLGSGLAKHAGARMIKPFLHYDLELENPFYEFEVLGRIVALSKNDIEKFGDKSGLFWKIFSKSYEKFGFYETLIKNTSKVRFQDGSEYGRDGISSILLAAGYDQKKTIEIFNSIFDANIDPRIDSLRLSNY